MGRKIVMWWKGKEVLMLKRAGPKSATYIRFFDELGTRDQLYFAFDLEAYKGGNTFLATPYTNPMSEKSEEVEADVVYHYSKVALPGQYTGTAPISNTPEFKEFCADKYVTYQYLSEFYPETFLIGTESELQDSLDKVATEKVVFKPRRGLNGTDVIITEKKNFEHTPDVSRVIREKNALLQEFINTANGIPGICSSYHDLRVITINDKISFVHIREPQQGSLVANMHQGASGRELEFSDLPDVLQTFYREVHARVRERFPRAMYSMDFGLGENGPKLYELNGHTAFPAPRFRGVDMFINNLIEHLETL